MYVPSGCRMRPRRPAHEELRARGSPARPTLPESASAGRYFQTTLCGNLTRPRRRHGGTLTACPPILSGQPTNAGSLAVAGWPVCGPGVSVHMVRTDTRLRASPPVHEKEQPIRAPRGSRLQAPGHVDSCTVAQTSGHCCQLEDFYKTALLLDSRTCETTKRNLPDCLLRGTRAL
jgi:hypothetical protein